MMRALPLAAFTLLATYMPFCPAPSMRPTAPRDQAEREIGELWEAPAQLERRDLRYGPWGIEHAPKPEAVYTFAHAKTHGVSPGVTVTDPEGREWSVKQGDEGLVEVLLSRILSAVGYHQPPVYYLKTFTLQDAHGTHIAPGGRFRPKIPELKDLGDWSFQRNPFVGLRPYEGLLVILMLFDSSDLKNSNNSLYEYRAPDGSRQPWYIVRDLGTALGETGRLDPKRNDPDIFERHRFISHVDRGLVEFSYHGWHQELYRDRITAADVRWACELVGQLSDEQWRTAFDAAGYQPDVAARFIAAIRKRLAEGRAIAS